MGQLGEESCMMVEMRFYQIAFDSGDMRIISKGPSISYLYFRNLKEFNVPNQSQLRRLTESYEDMANGNSSTQSCSSQSSR